MTLTLVSFKLCPFVQRSIIVLKEKQADFDIRYIDLRNKPEWFLEISPTGRVPLLMVGNEVLFESSAINEYLDETFQPPLHPTEPLLRAKNRAWIEMANQLSAAQFGFTMAKDENSHQQNLDKTLQLLSRLEQPLAARPGPFFNGADFAIIDATFAPFFTRQTMLEKWFGIDILRHWPSINRYGEALLSRPSVLSSVVSNYAELYRERLQQDQVWLLQAKSSC